MKAFQDHYPENVSYCYGCGSNNHHGHQIKTFWEGDETVTRFKPEPFHTSVPGYAYGGLIASLIDCHSTGTAAAAMYRSEGRDMDTLPAFRFVTGSLHVDFLKPTKLWWKPRSWRTAWSRHAAAWWRCKCPRALARPEQVLTA